MFKFKKKNKYVKLSKKEQKNYILNVIIQSITYIILFSIITLFFSKELQIFFKAINEFSLENKIKVILLTTPIFLILAALTSLGKLIVNKQK